MSRRLTIVGVIRAAGLSGVLFMAGQALPLVGPLVALFAGVPLLDCAVGRSEPMRRALGAIALASAAVMAVAGPFAAVGYLATFGLTSTIMVWMLERRRPLELIVTCGGAAMLVAGTIALVALAGSPAVLAKALRDSLEAELAHTEHFYKLLGLNDALSHDRLTLLVDRVVDLTPALATLSAVFVVLINLVAFWKWSGKRRLDYALFGDMARWSAPEWLIWALLATGFALFVPFDPMKQAALDAFLCVLVVYFCQGLAITTFYFKMLAMPPLARSIIYLVVVVQPVLAALVCGLGVFDMWVDFRRLKPQSPQAGNYGDFL